MDSKFSHFKVKSVSLFCNLWYTKTVTMILLLTFVAAFLNPILASPFLVCEDELYDVANQTCCNGTVHSRVGGTVDCCNSTNTLYNTENQLCSDDGIIEKEHKDTATVNGRDKQTGTQRPHYSDKTTTSLSYGDLVCGNELYNTTVEMCCNGKKYPKSGHQDCCKDDPYNRSTHMCCGDIVRPKSVLNEAVQCCGPNPYDPKKSLCCEDILYDKSPAHYGCCKTKLMARGDKCCGSKVHMQSNLSCCGNETYNEQKQWCYGNEKILGLNDSICGNMIYNRSEKMCCEGTVNPGTKGFRCCGSKSYNSTANDCRQGNIVTKGLLWCNGEYDPNTHDCCKDQLMKKNGSHWYCCGSAMINYDVENCCGAGSIFNKRNQRCCGGKVIEIEDKCCNGQPMDSETQLCCGKTMFTDEETIQKTMADHDQCCPNMAGGISYDSVNFDCLANYTVVAKQPSKNVCGRKEYNRTTDLCCNSKIFRNAVQRKMKCCLPNARIYDSKIQKCRHGDVRIRKRCPKKCRKTWKTLKDYCQKNTQVIKKISRRFLRRRLPKLLRRKTCECVYRRRRKGLVGISFATKRRSVLNYFPGQKRFIKQQCKNI